MISEKKLLEYTESHYPNESDLIVRTMINYYELKLKADKTDGEKLHQDKLFEGVIELFEILSRQLSTELKEESSDIFNSLKAIHIKT